MDLKLIRITYIWMFFSYSIIIQQCHANDVEGDNQSTSEIEHIQNNKTEHNSDNTLMNITTSINSTHASTENDTVEMQNVENNSEQLSYNSSADLNTPAMTTEPMSTLLVSDSSEISIKKTTVLDILNKSLELILDHLRNVTSSSATTETPKLTTGSFENKTSEIEIKSNETQIQESTTEASNKTIGSETKTNETQIQEATTEGSNKTTVEQNVLYTTEEQGSTKISDVDKKIMGGTNATTETNRTNEINANNTNLLNNSRINSVLNESLPKLDLMATTAVVINTSKVSEHNAQTTQSTPINNITAPLLNQTDQSSLRITTIGEKETRNTIEPSQSLDKTKTTTKTPVTKVTILKIVATETFKGTSEIDVNSIKRTDTPTLKTTPKFSTEQSTTFTTKAGIQILVTMNNEIATKPSSQKTIEKDMYKTAEIGGITENWMEFNISGFGVNANLEVHNLGDKEDDRYWPVVVAVTIGIPAIIIIGVTIIVMHRKRLGRRSLSRPNKLAYA
ncbi:uncharacterized protein LOC134705534 isoform X2 [Mytilus trossulus]|uniref:uncharacterized protein LOC134705534 isoform X2 n=1 Tax=Mytilus trossulus TaxID=6551 RepID=UPI003006B609